MHPRITELTSLLAEKRALLVAAAAAVPIEFREQRPAQNRWSVAQVLEHLSITDRRCAQLITHKLQSQPTQPDHQTTSTLDSFDFQQILNRTIKIEAREFVLPSGRLGWEAALRELEAARRELLEVILAADGADLTVIHHTHYVLGELNLYQWIAFVAMHEARHTDQIRENVEVLDGVRP